jgi:hypothetical protein
MVNAPGAELTFAGHGINAGSFAPATMDPHNASASSQ